MWNLADEKQHSFFVNNCASFLFQVQEIYGIDKNVVIIVLHLWSWSSTLNFQGQAWTYPKMQHITRKNSLVVFHPFHRIKIMQNIGVSFVKMAQFSDAITSFEHIMGEKASFQTGEL